MTDWNREDRRTDSRLHEDDISQIVAGVAGSLNNHYCRFSSIKIKDMETVVEFVRGVMDTTTTTKKLIWKLVVSITVIALLGWLAVGFLYKLADAIKEYIR